MTVMCRWYLSASYIDILLASTGTNRLLKPLIWDLDITFYRLEGCHATANQNANSTSLINRQLVSILVTFIFS